MNKNETFQAKLLRNTSLAIATSLLIACGGGGGGSSDSKSSSNNNTGTVDVEQPSTDLVPTDANNGDDSFAPDGERMLVEAENSSELYVEPNFGFQFSRLVEVEVSAKDMDGSDLADAVVLVYSISKEVEEWSDELLDEASLVARGITDVNGDFTRTVNLFKNDQQLLLVIDVVGIENKVIVEVDGDSISYGFNEG
ncbi:MAG: hypothetical protein MI867_09950 [Pseudomonadales bacterium]|nr:hypothetical protein [Pseudomonadales bacterium]